MNHKSDNEDKLSMSYFFHDLNFKLTNIFNERSRMSLSVYSGEDRLDAKDEWHSNNSSGYNDVDIYVNRFHWGNFNAALDWNYQFSPSSLLTSQPSIRTIAQRLAAQTSGDLHAPERKNN